ncbi:MAG TPA: glycosyl transferase, partial [Ohtaekwangia sp.]|uniref:glycosyl transferase n=1 Tax=Ohtaekwangia sp. TaxID=2066019 RepID=UPI002F927BC2
LVSGKKKSLFQKVSTWVRGNLFIPDPRVFWVKPSVRFLLKYVQEQGIKTIITTGPPHSVHLIGLKLKRKNPSLKWLADFRDPWSDWGLLDSLMVGGIARSMHRRLETQVVRTADEVITITPFYVRKFEKLSGRPVRLLTNGFDEDDFKNLVITRHTKFIIRHAGIVNEKCDPRPFMLAVKSLLQEQRELREKLQIDFVGEVHPDFRAFVLQDDDLKSITTFTPTIPHKQLMALYGESAIMLLVLTGYKDAEGYMPGKLFEYLATGLPVLGVGPEQGDAAALLNISGAGVMIDGNHTAAIKTFIQQKFNAWKSTDSIAKAPGSQIYSRRAITQTLTEML